MLTEQCVACGTDVPLSGAVHMLVNPKDGGEVTDGYLCRGCYEDHVEPILPGDADADDEEADDTAGNDGEAGDTDADESEAPGRDAGDGDGPLSGEDSEDAGPGEEREPGEV